MDPAAALRRVLEEPEPSLLDGALCIAALDGRTPEVDALEAGLDAIGSRVDAADLPGIVAALGAAGLRGARERYDDPRNSLIDLVVVRRVGIPITLSLVAIEVGRRCGVALTPVGMPGHFLVGETGGDDRFGDPFHGRVVDRAGCAAILERVVGGARPLRATDLTPIPAAAVFARMLNNLAAGPWGRDLVRLARIVDLQLAIDRLAAPERLALAGRLEQLGRFAEAAEQLARLRVVTGGAAAEALATRLRAQRARYN